MNKQIMVIFCSLSTLLVGCNKSDSVCFSDPGEIKNELRMPDSDFRGLVLTGNIDVDLVASNQNMFEVIAGEKLLSSITTEVTDSVLTIANEAECSFLSNADRPAKVIVYYTLLDSIIYRSNGNLTTLGEIKNANFKIDIYEGSGSIHLRLNTLQSKLNYHFGTADLTVEGTSNVNYVYHVSYGPLDARNLETGFTFLESRSANDCIVRSSIQLGATINGPGNVYYYGRPQEVTLDGSGSGKLIPME